MAIAAEWSEARECGGVGHYSKLHLAIWPPVSATNSKIKACNFAVADSKEWATGRATLAMAFSVQISQPSAGGRAAQSRDVRPAVGPGGTKSYVGF